MADATNSAPTLTEAPAEDGAEFDAAFDEAAAGSHEPDPAEKTGDDEPSGEGTGDQPSPEQPGQKAAPAEDASAAAPQDDIWAGVPEATRTALEARLSAAENRERSLNNRLSDMGRQVAELRRQPQTQAEKVEQQADADALSAEIAKLREDYPEIAGPILTTLDRLTKQVEGLQAPVEQVQQDRDERFLNRQLGEYEKAHPDWRNYAAHDKWADWIVAQPRHIREAAARNSQVIVDGAEAADVLSRFKAAIEPAPTPTPSPQPDPRRERQKGAARSSNSPTVPVASGVPDDFDAAFDVAAGKQDATRGLKR